MKVGIVGSRRRYHDEDRDIVYAILSALINEHGIDDIHIISGGCADGADNFAEQFAKIYGCTITIYYPQNIPDTKSYIESVERYYKRNAKIASDCDVLYALVSPNRTGGTENTIKYATSLKKKIYLK